MGITLTTSCFEITVCDFKLGRFKKSKAIRLHRAGGGHVTYRHEYNLWYPFKNTSRNRSETLLKLFKKQDDFLHCKFDIRQADIP